MKIRLLPAFAAMLILASCGTEEEPEIPEVKGCMDKTSLTYNAAANVDDGNCLYAEEEQRSLFIKYTGTWCWACGDYGAKIVKEVKDKNGDNVVVLEVHKGSDPMNNSVANAWTANWSHSSTPSFVANHTLLTGYPTTAANEEISRVNIQSPKIGFHNEFTIDGKTLTGTAYVQALEEMEGSYNLGIYVVGQGYVHKQIADDGSSHPDWEFDMAGKYYPEYIHHDILYGEVNNEAFGSIAFSGSASDKQVSKQDYTYTLGADWPEEIDIVLIVWKRTPSTYEFINIKSYSNK